MQLQDILAMRQSTRRFTGEQISEEQLLALAVGYPQKPLEKREAAERISVNRI